MTTEQRTHLLAQAEYWDEEQHQTYAEAIRAVLDDYDRQARDLEALRGEVALYAEAANRHAAEARRQAEELALLRRVECGFGTVSPRDDAWEAWHEWRARFGGGR